MYPKVCPLLFSDSSASVLIGFEMYMNRSRMSNEKASRLKILSTVYFISRLKLYHQKQDEKIKSEKERQKAKEEFRQQQEKITRSQQTLQSLSDRLNELGQQLGTQKAGYDFQDWFYDLLDFFEFALKYGNFVLKCIYLDINTNNL